MGQCLQVVFAGLFLLVFFVDCESEVLLESFQVATVVGCILSTGFDLAQPLDVTLESRCCLVLTLIVLDECKHELVVLSLLLKQLVLAESFKQRCDGGLDGHVVVEGDLFFH